MAEKYIKVTQVKSELGHVARNRGTIRALGLDRIGELKVLIDDMRAVADKAQRAGDFEQASKLLYAEIPTFEEELARVTAETTARETSMVQEEVTADDIAEVVATWTGITARTAWATFFF